MTGELQETVDKTAPCAAITEKRPNRLGGCVGVFFQLFDWNRRFAKRKLFSRKSLLNGKQASKRFGGNEKMLKSKLNLIDDENRGSFVNRGEVVKHEMRSPSLVARLMGLESMPSNHRDKAKKKKTKCNLIDEEDEEDDNGFDKSRPQKMQRTTGTCDRRVVVKKLGSDALQIKNVLTRVKKHHQYNSHQHHHQHQKKLASPVQSPRLLHRRTSSSRLIDAATRILEPGKQRKIAYHPGSSGIRSCENAGKEPVEIVAAAASCKACGSFVDVLGSVPVAEEIGKNIESTPFERSKRNVFWRNQEPPRTTNQMEKKALHRVQKDERFPPEARAYMLQSKRVCSSSSTSPANVIKCKEKDFIAMNRGLTRRNHHHLARFENSDLRKSQSRAEESCNRSGLSTTTTPPRKRRLACGSGSSSMSPPVSRRVDGECSCDCSNETPLKLGSLPHRSYRESKEPQRRPNQKRLPLDAATLGLIQQKLKKLAAQEEDEAITRGSALLNQSSASLILHELLSSLALEQRYTETAYRRKGKTELWNSDYTSPGSVLDASFSNESCFSNSFDNISVPGHVRLLPLEPDWDVLEDGGGGNYQAIASLVSHVFNVLRCLSNTGLILTQQRFNVAREVIINTELLVGTSPTQENNYLIGPELFDELMIYTARSDNLVNLPGVTGGFLVDAMIEHLEERNSSCGLLLKQPLSVEADGLIQGVIEDVPKWAKLARIGVDEVVSIEMEKWFDLEAHLFGVGSEIAYEIFMFLLGELAMDLF
ncbi:unnamed protein product [Microthlaspi erraticum]|uniref:Uncharacterized protein n=1 Tax=Microthlaspi erraticum TaxID=1685480 RepID=A0A6D2HM38_9BRAS|nr:unnamed protein product [Microthlaspi erraticum]